MLAGLGTAGYGLYDIDQSRGGLLPDADRRERDEALVLWGGVAAALGLILLLAGLIVAVRGAPARPVPVAGAAAPPSSPAPHDPSSRGALVAGAIGLLLVGGLVALVFYMQSDGEGLFGGGGGDGPTVTSDETHNGTVRAARLTGIPGIDRYAFDDANEGTFVVPADAVACDATLSWDPAAGSGADRLALEVSRGGSVVAAGAGGPGLTVHLEGEGLAGVSHHFAVWPAADVDAVAQDFQLRVVCLRA
jgi:hypothetical protein